VSLVHRCPKCATYLKPPLPAEAQCPSCGIWFHKWNAPVPSGSVAAIALDPDEDDGAIPLEAFNPFVFGGRIATVVLVTVWGLFLMALDYKSEEVTGNFMHAILLPIHEAGHIVFSPFGAFMTTLGGSLFQVALPFGIAVAFYVKQREPFGAAVCLWWTGTSLVDLSAYVWDALHPQLILTSGTTGENGEHDWVAILGDIGQLKNAHGWGVFIHHVGVLVMLAGIAWAAWYCWRSWKERDEGPSHLG